MLRRQCCDGSLSCNPLDRKASGQIVDASLMTQCSGAVLFYCVKAEAAVSGRRMAIRGIAALHSSD